MITIVMPYYENGGMLERHLSEWYRYDTMVKENMRAVIVDDGSERDRAADHMRSVGFPVELYRIKQNIPWNVPGARNLGMQQASGWCLLTDIDHLLTAEEAVKLGAFARELVPGVAYVPARRWADGRELHRHPNTYLLQQTTYWATGGTDEDFSGWWGAGESSFRKALTAVAAVRESDRFTLAHFGRDDIADASTREWGRRGSDWEWSRNAALVKKTREGPYWGERPLRFEWERVEWQEN